MSLLLSMEIHIPPLSSSSLFYINNLDKDRGPRGASKVLQGLYFGGIFVISRKGNIVRYLRMVDHGVSVVAMEGDEDAEGFDGCDGGLVDGAEGWGCRGGGGRVLRPRWRR
jgi:hypothetical protein